MDEQKTYRIADENIGGDATYEDAAVVADYLTRHGYPAEAVRSASPTDQSLNDIPDDIWTAAVAEAAP